MLEQALVGYAQFQQLTEQYAQIVIEQTRQQLAGAGVKKAGTSPQLLLAQEEEIGQLMARFAAQEPTGTFVRELEVLVRTAFFEPANALVGHLLQSTADRIDAACQPRPGQVRQGRVACKVQGLFGCFSLVRDYYCHAGKKQDHYPAYAALGLEVGCTPALARILCLQGADESSYQKAELHLAETSGRSVSARQIQRVVRRVGPGAQAWQERRVQPEQCERSDASVFCVSADGTGAPMRLEELEGRRSKQADGKAKTPQVYLGCVFTQARLDAEGHPVRDCESTTCVSSLDSIDQLGPMLRREALRRGMGTAREVALLIDGAEGLAHMDTLCFKGACKSWTSSTRWITPAMSWRGCWGANNTPTTSPGYSVGPTGCSKTKSKNSSPRVVWRRWPWGVWRR